MSEAWIKKAVAYRRVSTERQFDDGIGLEGQLAAIKSYADSTGTMIIGDLVDGHSGMGDQTWRFRPGLQKAIALASRHAVPIIICGVDRLTRNAASLEDLVRETQVAFHSIKDGTSDPVVLRSQAARAQREGEEISYRTRKALQALKEKGVKLGNPTNLPDAQKKGAESNRKRGEEVVRRVYDVLKDMDDPHDVSCGDVVDRLNELAITTGTNRPWTTSALRRPLSKARELLAVDNHTGSEPETDPASLVNHPLYGRF